MSKVNRDFDGIEREESTAGLMVLRIFIIFVIVGFVAASAWLFYGKLKRETENNVPAVTETVDTDAFYQKYDTNAQSVLLKYVNGKAPISDYEEFEIVDLGENIRINQLAKTSFERMTADAAKNGIDIKAVKGFMTAEECNAVFKTYLLDFEKGGIAHAQSEIMAKEIFPPAEYNEFRTGLLVRLSEDESEEFQKSDEYAWLYKNGVNYGFINRYTGDKKSVTGINEDLTVYRFVGTENAQKMRSFGMCLEEYSEYRSAR